MIAIYQETIDEIKKAWEYCGFVISDEEIFKIAEEMERTIEKWENEEDWDKLEDWCDKVENAIGEYHTDKLYNGYLSMNEFEDEFDVAVEDSKLEITLSETGLNVSFPFSTPLLV